MDVTNLALFATEGRPLRCSALPLLVVCPWRAVMLSLALAENGSSKAADTGSAVHKAVEQWHRNGQDFTSAVKAMRDSLAEYPLADLHDAELSFRPYSNDPRNAAARIVAAETRVLFSIRPAPHDPTQTPIFVRGTLDQVRELPGGTLALFDVKTGQRNDGWGMMHEYALQMAGYCIGATQLLGRPVVPGALIRTRGYRTRGAKLPDPPGVFFEFAWGLSECELLLDAVRNTVADIRAGRVHAAPGDHCTYCPAKGLEACLPLLASIK